MAKQPYKTKRFTEQNIELIEKSNEVIAEFMADGFRMTLRQLYYQMIAKDLFPETWIDRAYNLREGLDADTKNTVKNYKTFGGLLSNARLAGLVDWEAIEDRGRQPHTPSEFNSLDHLIRVALEAYRLPRWEDQEYYAELWVEKDALADVLEPMSQEFHVTLQINKGYSSQSAMYEAAQRFIDNGNGRPCILFYMGDFDPSGQDMIRDIHERLDMFGVPDLEVRKIALTRAQIDRYHPPPNPAKSSDPRFKKFVLEHGRQSWEVDALRPNVMHGMVRTAFEKILDRKKMDAIIAQEELEKNLLKKAVKSIMKKSGGKSGADS